MPAAASSRPIWLASVVPPKRRTRRTRIMSDSPARPAADPWLAIIGIGEDGLTGLSQSSRDALAKAEIVFGGPRHLRLAEIDARGCPWPVPFSVDPVLDCRGRRVAVLASGDPFWHGAGGSLAAH